MTAQSFRRKLVIAAVLALAVAAGASARSDAATPSSQAAQLAARASGAKTSAAKYQALLGIAKATGLPVLTAAGKPLTPRSRALPARFNLYDFQLQVAAASSARRDTLTIAGLAQLFDRAGAKIAAPKLAGQLRAGVRAATAKAGAPASLLGLIVRDLGLHHRPSVDLAKTATATTQLDPLQTLLIAADTALHGTGARALAAETGSQSGPCEDTTAPGTEPIPITGPQSWVIGTELTRALLLIQSTEVTVLNAPLRETHYGPAGHAALAGKTLRLGIHAEVKYKLPTSVICGLLAGKRFPLPGPLKNAAVFWRPGDLLEHGSIDFDPADMKTGSDGNSTLVFTPKTENVPGFGTEYKATGQVTATVGGAATATAGLLTASQNWTVEYHKPRGFKFTMPSITFTNTAPEGTKTVLPVSITGRVCGDDPYTVPWAINESIKGIQANYDVTLPEGLPVTTGQIGDFPHEWKLVDQGGGDLEASVKITPGAPFSGTFDPPSASVKARVVEDKSCPDNSDDG